MGSLRPLMAKNGAFGPKLAIFGPFPYHWMHFSDEICIESSSFTCFTLWCTIWSTFASCLGRLGPLMAQKWRFWSQMGQFGAISTPLGAFFWQVLHLGWSSHMCITVIHHLIHFCQPSGASGASYGQKRRFWPKKKGLFLAITVPNQGKLVSTKWIYNPLNISDQFCYKSFCRL